MKDIDFNNSRVIDFGCGEGIFLNELLHKGIAKALAFDIDDQMIEKALNLFTNQSNVSVKKGGIELLDSVDSQSQDVVLALNVMAYFTAGEERLFYENISRILKKGGYFVVTHSNQIFDFFTLNKFTIDTIGEQLTGNDHKSDLASLITNSEVPEVVPFGIRENPLSYDYKLNEYGMSIGRIEYINYHKVPPLIDSMDKTIRIDIDYLDTTKVPAKDKWKLSFQCSTFAALIRKNT
jgi:SAM-dependent methyltransferase